MAHAVSKLKSATTARLMVPCSNSGVVLIVFMLGIYAARSDRRYCACARFSMPLGRCTTLPHSRQLETAMTYRKGPPRLSRGEDRNGGSVRRPRNASHRQDAARAGRLRSMPATNSGMLIGLARKLEVSVAIGAHLRCCPYQQSNVEFSSSNSALISYL